MERILLVSILWQDFSSSKTAAELIHWDFMWKKICNFYFSSKAFAISQLLLYLVFVYSGLAFQQHMVFLKTSRYLKGLMTTDHFYISLWFFLCPIFKNLFVCMVKIQVPSSRFWLLRLLGTNWEDRTVSLGWSYFLQPYDNLIIDILITVSESFNSSPWNKSPSILRIPVLLKW